MPAVRSAQDLGASIRSARVARGWTQTQLADASGTTRQWVSLVEHGHPRAEMAMLVATLRALDVELRVAVAQGPGHSTRTWMTAADAAEAIREELDRGDTDFALRMLTRAVGDFRDLDEDRDLALYLAEPPSTGDHRWDVLLAAVLSRECRHRGIDPPAWSRVPALRTWWFPAADPVLDARTMQRTPIDLSIKGIWLDERALETL